jgi:hypothetical protein
MDGVNPQRTGSCRNVNRLLTAVLGLVLGLLLASCSSAPPPAPPQPPGPGVGALAGWKLTLPLPGKKGNAEILEPAQVAPPWLTADPNGNLTFWAPVSGATTEHSEHPRTELDNLSNFQAGSGPQALTASVSVAQVPTQGQDVIIGQIHGADDISSVPFVMLHYTDGTVTAVVKQQQKGEEHINYPLLYGVPLGQRFDFGIRDNGNGNLTFTATAGDQKASVDAPLPAAFAGATVRFQAGAYQQSGNDTSGLSGNVTSGTDPAPTASGPDDGARLTFYALQTGLAAAPAAAPPTS